MENEQYNFIKGKTDDAPLIVIPSFKDNSLDLKKEIEKLQELYINDLISMDNYKTRYDSLAKELVKLKEKELKVNTLPLDRSKEFKQIMSGRFKDIYYGLTRKERRNIWQNLIKEIHYNGNNIPEKARPGAEYPDGTFDIIFL